MKIDPPTLPNVIAQFEGLIPVGDPLAAWSSQTIKGRKYSRFHEKMGSQNHFQGFQRLQDSNYAIISGGYPYKGKSADLFIVHLKSRPAIGALGSNLRRSKKPPKSDKVVSMISLDKYYWHAGGISVLGDLLVVPMEESKKGGSRIGFYDVSVPTNPTSLGIDIYRNERKAGAAAVTRLENGHFLLAVWSDSESKMVPPRHRTSTHPWRKVTLPQRLDLYLSKTTDVRDGFRSRAVSLTHEVQEFEKFQGLNFLWQKDGKLFLVGFDNTSFAAPTIDGDDLAYLYEVGVPRGLKKSIPDWPSTLSFKHCSTKEVRCHDRQCNMDGGSGIYVHHSKELFVYSVYHYQTDLPSSKSLRELTVKFTEFRTSRVVRSISDLNRGWIDLYEHSDLKGKKLSVSGSSANAVPDLNRVFVDNKPFGGRASSAQFQLPAGWSYVLYSNSDYNGAKRLVLTGTGRLRSALNFKKHDFGDRAQSAKLIHTEKAIKMRGAIVV